MRLLKLSLPIIALVLVTACQSSGRTYSEMEKPNALPPIEKGKGRIFLYRYSTMAFALQPPVRIDGNVVGHSVPEGFFYVDLPAGSHRITENIGVERSLALVLHQKQTVYIRETANIGAFMDHMDLEKVDAVQAKNEMTDLHYQNDAKTNTGN